MTETLRSVATLPKESWSIPTGYRRLVFALLRQPRWLGLAALTLAMCVLFWWLGTWQWGRHLDRADRNAAIEQAQSAEPADLAEVVANPADSPDAAVYRPVTTAGTYLADGQVLQRNPRGRSGYAVITPLELDDGGTLLVDRGWVAASPTDANTPAADVAPPEGPVSVTVRLRAAQPSSDRQAPVGQIYDIDPGAMSETLPQPVYALYGELVDQTPAPAGSLELPEPSQTGLGVHLFYAIQWWLFIVIALVGFGTLIRRESRVDDRARHGDTHDAKVH